VNLCRFAGLKNRKEAATMLDGADEGTYLVRVGIDDESTEEKFALSVKCVDFICLTAEAVCVMLFFI
jgi:hypothetical protein